jgi:hypothetical protein
MFTVFALTEDVYLRCLAISRCWARRPTYLRRAHRREYRSASSEDNDH